MRGVVTLVAVGAILAGATVASTTDRLVEPATRCAMPGPIDRDPTWSPGGTIAFGRPGRIVFARPGRSTVTSVVAERFPSRLAWSPTGERLAWWDGAGSVAVADSRGRITMRFEASEGPVWSPDGTRLAIVGPPLAGTPSSIEVVSPADGSRRTVAAGSEPSWSPDGRRLAYTGAGSSPTLSAIHVVDDDGTGDRVVAGEQPGPYATALGRARWRPGSDEIAYVRRDVLGGDTLWLVDAAGANPRQLTRQGIAQALDFEWAPDGRRVVVRLYNSQSYSGIGVFDVSSRTWRTRTVVGRDLSDPSWSHDGRRLAFTSFVHPKQNETFDRAEIWLADAGMQHLARLTNHCVVGTSRRDILHGTPLPDIVRVGDGDDTVFVRDRRRDVVWCGSGRDTVHADRVDRLHACEIILYR